LELRVEEEEEEDEEEGAPAARALALEKRGPGGNGGGIGGGAMPRCGKPRLLIYLYILCNLHISIQSNSSLQISWYQRRLDFPHPGMAPPLTPSPQPPDPLFSKAEALTIGRERTRRGR
jgi:hypothetical protein